MPAVGQVNPSTPWPLSVALQGAVISAAITTYGVPAVVFMGMYNTETTLGNNVHNSSSSPPAVGPFQFTGSDKGTGNFYPLTNAPTLAEFQQQANAAAAYLSALYKQFHDWHSALAAYNAGPNNISAGQSYATTALAFQIPADWRAALGGVGINLGPATPGGTANAGGTGTLPNDALTSGFQVGDASNPDEDYWTAINRIAQERYWYVFSDGETLYLADGPDLMRQVPALTVDRVSQSGNIASLDFTWDNTAWTYAVTHKRRKRAQRRSTLAKVTSPVEAQLEYICKIDEVRAGDVVTLSNCGPGDGKWLAGDVRRSVFDVHSEISLVVALSPLTEGELNPAGVNQFNITTQYGPNVGVGNIKGYVNPVGNWNPGRLDQGVDGTLVSNYLAPGDSADIRIFGHGWPGGTYITGRLTSGSLAGKWWYVAEGITPMVSSGAVVKAGTAIARPSNGIDGTSRTGLIETGWANPSNPSQTLAQGLGTHDDQSDVSLACGNSFNRFITKLGGRPGAAQDRGIGVAPAGLPGGYP